jgi:guanylate kinase
MEFEDNCIAVSNRYGRTYGFDQPEFERMMSLSQIPVVHVGDIGSLERLRLFFPDAISVLLWCSRDETERRSAERGDRNVSNRLTAWDQLATELDSAPINDFSLNLNTEINGPAQAAERIAILVAPKSGEKP